MNNLFVLDKSGCGSFCVLKSFAYASNNQAITRREKYSRSLVSQTTIRACPIYHQGNQHSNEEKEIRKLGALN